ncbi:hypothetical protein SCLCIDRAFT_114441, partial [Scleroderma citrinum Foug A]
KTALAFEIRNACMEVGPFYSEQTRAYFSLLLETKMKVAFPLGYILFFISHSRWWLYHRRIENFQRYAPFLDSNTDPFNRGDLLEGFAAGWEELALEENDETSGNNDHLVTIPRQVYTSRHTARAVGKVLYRLFALDLDLPETYFDDKYVTILWQEPDIQALQVLSPERQWINVTPIPGTWVVK